MELQINSLEKIGCSYFPSTDIFKTDGAKSLFHYLQESGGSASRVSYIDAVDLSEKEFGSLLIFLCLYGFVDLIFEYPNNDTYTVDFYELLSKEGRDSMKEIDDIDVYEDEQILLIQSKMSIEGDFKIENNDKKKNYSFDIKKLLKLSPKSLQYNDYNYRIVQLKEGIILLTDLLDSTNYYEKYGDVKGFYKVQDKIDLLTPVLEENDAYIVKTMGDAIMAFILDPLRAIQIIRLLEEALIKYNEGKNEDKKIKIRLSMHLGKMIRTINIKTNDLPVIDFFGQVVNEASRLQEATKSEEKDDTVKKTFYSVISDDVYQKINNDKTFTKWFEKSQEHPIRGTGKDGEERKISVYRYIAQS